MTDLTARFWAKVFKTESCWIWTGSKVHGYGNIGNGKKIAKAHRVSWELHFGGIPAGKHVLHACDNRPCVNPDHLWLGTHADNMRDMKEKGRHVKAPQPGELNAMARLTVSQVKAIRERYANGKVTQDQLGREYGVAHSTISAITRRENWAHE